MDQIKLSTNFFESVSKHDLERFHSECLCWLFNNNKQLASGWINETIFKHLPEKVEIEINSIEAYTEVDQIDIVILYKKKSFNNYFGIIIENKIKANEHSIKVKKPEQFLSFKKGDELSQTEFYYFRNTATKEIIEKNNYKTSIQVLGDNIKIKKSKKTVTKAVLRKDCHYIYLVPNKIIDVKSEYLDLVGKDYEYNKINNWRKGNNPWLTYTYIELADFLSQNKSLLNKSNFKNEIYANDYIDFLFSQFIEHVNLNNYSKNKFGKLEYIKFLRHAIFLRLDEKLKELNKDGKVDSKSSNSGDPLFNIIISDKVELSVSDQKFELGLQVQGLTNKIYISAGQNYHSFKFSKENFDYKDKLNNYIESVDKILNKIIQKLQIKLKPNKNSTKSFYSYSFKFNKENDIGISDKINDLSNLINSIYYIYNNTSFTSTSESNSKLSK